MAPGEAVASPGTIGALNQSTATRTRYQDQRCWRRAAEGLNAPFVTH